MGSTSLCSDFYSVYVRRDDILHSYCGAHLIREAKKIAEMTPTAITIEFADKLRALYRKGETAADFDTRESVRSTFQWLTGVRRFGKNPDVHRIRLRIHDHFEGYVAFLGRDDIPWNNNGSERDLRPMCIVRKISGGTRSERGSTTAAHWMSLTQTLRKNGTDIEHWVPGALDALRFGRALPSVFAAPS